MKQLKFDPVFRFIAAVVLFLALTGFLPVSGGGHVSGFNTGGFLSTALGLTAMALFFTGTQMAERRERLVWTLLSAGILMVAWVYSAYWGDILGHGEDASEKQEHMLSILEDGSILLYFLLLAASLLVDRSRTRSVSLFEKLSLGTFFLGLFAYCTISGDIYGSLEGGPDYTWSYIMFLVLDLYLFTVLVLRSISSDNRRWVLVCRCLAASMLMFFFNDFLELADGNSWIYIAGTAEQGGDNLSWHPVVNLVWLGNFIALAAAARIAAVFVEEEGRESEQSRRKVQLVESTGVMPPMVVFIFVFLALHLAVAPPLPEVASVGFAVAETESTGQPSEPGENSDPSPAGDSQLSEQNTGAQGKDVGDENAVVAPAIFSGKEKLRDWRQNLFLSVIFALTILAMLQDRWLAKQRRKLLQKVENYDTRLQQSQKLEAVGRLVGGVAHDFNNQIHIIANCNEQLLDNTPQGDPRRKALEMIDRASRRSSESVNQLFLLKEGQEARSKPLDLVAVVEEMRPGLADLIGDPLDLEVSGDCGSSVIVADPIQVQSVVTNLVLNARDASKYSFSSGSRGAIHISIGPRSLAEIEQIDALVVPSSEISGNCIELAVTDRGSGIPYEDQGRIFEPFFTGKESDSGSEGLGLYKTYHFVKELGGSFAVDSTPGVGTRIRVFFPATSPLADQAAASEPQLPEAQMAPSTSERRVRVLLVDDEDDLRNSLSLGLSSLGIEITSAASGKEALQVFESLENSPEAFEVVVTDMVMPGMPGDELARQLRVIRPTLQVIYISGNREPKEALNAQVGGSSTFLRKPFSHEALLRQIFHARDCDREQHPSVE